VRSFGHLRTGAQLVRSFGHLRTAAHSPLWWHRTYNMAGSVSATDIVHGMTSDPSAVRGAVNQLGRALDDLLTAREPPSSEDLDPYPANDTGLDPESSSATSPGSSTATSPPPTRCPTPPLTTHKRVNGRLEHLRGIALGFRPLTHSLL
jgi:hypothetical protein